MNDEQTYPSLTAFYAADRRRLTSPEWDYGVMWQLDDGPLWPEWRVAWVVETGEVYAVSNAGKDVTVQVLGVVEKVGEYPYDTSRETWSDWAARQPIEQVMRDWAEEPHRPLSWISGRLAGVPA